MKSGTIKRFEDLEKRYINAMHLESYKAQCGFLTKRWGKRAKSESSPGLQHCSVIVQYIHLGAVLYLRSNQ